MNCSTCQNKLAATYIQYNELVKDNSVVYSCNNHSCPSRYSFHKVQVEIYHQPPNIQNVMGYDYIFLDKKDETKGYLLSGKQTLDITSLEVIKISKPYQQSFSDGYAAYVPTFNTANTATTVFPSSYAATISTSTASTTTGSWGSGGSVIITAGTGNYGTNTGGLLTLQGGNSFHSTSLPLSDQAIKVKYVPISANNIDQEILKIYKRLKNLIIYS